MASQPPYLSIQTKMLVPKREPPSDDWPKLPAEEEFISASEMRNVKIYHYLDKSTEKIDANRTLRTMFWLFNPRFNEAPGPYDPTLTLSAYLSIMNIFTYPLFENMPSNISDSVGLRFLPTPISDLTWPKQKIPDFDTPLSSDDRLAALAIYILLFEFDYRPSIISLAGNAILEVGAFDSHLLNTKLGQEQCMRTAAFMMHPDNLPFTRYIYDCLLQKAAECKNKKSLRVLKFCGARFKKVTTCKTILFKAN